jgi:hypothetical protein
MKKQLPQFIILMIFFSILLPGCASQEAGAATAIENYLQALVERDLDQLINQSCTAWEAQARTEFDSFNAVSTELKDMVCSEMSFNERDALVKCTGKIIANYGNEVLEIDLGKQTYLAVNESGEWRMCGYQ